MKLELNTLEIRALLKCNEGMLKRSYLSQLYAKHPLKERVSAIEHLIELGYISAIELPKPGTKIAPVFYEITEKGREWVKKYLDDYPEPFN